MRDFVARPVFDALHQAGAGLSFARMSAASALHRLLTRRRLRQLASGRSFERGETYFRERRVLSLVQRAGALTATVRGAEDYSVRLGAADGALRFHCSCPVGGDGEFCKHQVAVALAWLADRQAAEDAEGETAGTAVVKLDDVQPWLLQQEKSTLAAWLLEAAERDPRLRERLLRQAARATNRRADFSAYRRAIDRATPNGAFVAYDEAGGFTDNLRETAIEPLRELLQEGHAGEVIALAEHALRRVERVIEQADDSDGHFGAILGELQELHLEACRVARPEPAALADRLFAWEVDGDWEVFFGAAETYAEILGEKGLAVYRARAEAAWKTLPALRPGEREEHSSRRFRVTSIMESLARTTGDLDALVAIKAKNLSDAYAFLQIAELYREARRPDDALAWAERGLKAFPQDTDSRLLAFLAAEYHRRGRHDDAIALAWRQFEGRPSLENYRLLKSHADRAEPSAWQSCRERALALLRQRLAKPARRGRFAFWSAESADRSTLVEIFLWEKAPALAWAEAQAGDCDSGLMLRLAAVREKTHPADAIPIYLRRAETLVAQTNNRAYEEAARHLKKVKALHLALDRSHAWADLRTRLCTEHKAKRNFMALMANL